MARRWHADAFLLKGTFARGCPSLSGVREVASAGPGGLPDGSPPRPDESIWGEQMTTQVKSLYDRLGGLGAINALTTSWVARVGGDDRANGKFVRTDIPRLMKEVAEHLCEVTGGPCTYTGRSMAETHAGMGTTAGEFDIVVQHLNGALDDLNVPEAEQDELVGLLLPMRSDIVEVESLEMGTPLPGSYQTAPPLM